MENNSLHQIMSLLRLFSCACHVLVRHCVLGSPQLANNRGWPKNQKDRWRWLEGSWRAISWCVDCDRRHDEWCVVSCNNRQRINRASYSHCQVEPCTHLPVLAVLGHSYTTPHYNDNPIILFLWDPPRTPSPLSRFDGLLQATGLQDIMFNLNVITKTIITAVLAEIATKILYKMIHNVNGNYQVSS